MKIKYKTEKNDVPYLKTSLKQMNKKTIKVGALNGDSRWIASIQEFGCTIPVTDKMRAYLHRNGLHLKESTTEIKIPERSFLRSGHDKNIDRVINQTERAIGQVLNGKMSVDDMLDLCGQQLCTAIKKYMRDLDKPELHPYTISQKGSSNPLVNTGALIESIVWEIE